MSDEDFMYSEGDDFDIEYEEFDENDNEYIVENIYIEAKELKRNDAKAALLKFEEIIQNDTDSTEWGYKSLKQSCKINLNLGNFEEALDFYSKSLNYKSSDISRNSIEKSIFSILKLVSSKNELIWIDKFYATTIKNIPGNTFERLRLKVNLNLANMLLELKHYRRLVPLLREMRESCYTANGTEDPLKSSQLLEIYSLEIQLFTIIQDFTNLKKVYMLCGRIDAGSAHPRTLGVIEECGGKIKFREEDWEGAVQCFFQSFKSYDEAGSDKRIQVLKYLVIANMLSRSTVDPFESQETKPYRNDKRISALVDLVTTYQSKDVRGFDNVLKNAQADLVDDPLVKFYLDDVIKSIRGLAIARLVASYTRIKFAYISKQLNIPVKDVQSILEQLILDQQVKGFIDYANQMLELDSKAYNERWDSALTEILGTVKRRRIQVASSFT